jgi:hypothetical protein
MTQQQQHENQQSRPDTNSGAYANQPQGKIKVPLKNRLVLAGGLLLSSATLLLGQLIRALGLGDKTFLGITFFLSLFLNIGLLFYALWYIKKSKQGGESRFIFLLGVVLLILGFGAVAGLLVGLVTRVF